MADISRFLIKQYYQQAAVNVYNKRRKNKAATVIQCNIRVRLAKFALQNLMLKKLAKAAVFIQKISRRHLAKKLLMKLRHQALQKKRNRAATKVESVIRGFLGRHRVDMLRFRLQQQKEGREKGNRIIES